MDVGVSFMLKDKKPEEPPWESTAYQQAAATPEPTPGPTAAPTPTPTPLPRCVKPSGTTVTFWTKGGKATLVISEGTYYFVLSEETDTVSGDVLLKATYPGAEAPFFVLKESVVEVPCP